MAKSAAIWDGVNVNEKCVKGTRKNEIELYVDEVKEKLQDHN